MWADLIKHNNLFNARILPYFEADTFPAQGNNMLDVFFFSESFNICLSKLKFCCRKYSACQSLSATHEHHPKITDILLFCFSIDSIFWCCCFHTELSSFLSSRLSLLPAACSCFKPWLHVLFFRKREWQSESGANTRLIQPWVVSTFHFRAVGNML